MTTILDQFRLTNRRALITGGAKGLGRIMTQALAQAGADVAIASRNRADCEQAAADLSKETGRKIIGLGADVSQQSDVTKLVEDCQRLLGPIDILINNAGVNIRGPSHELSEADWNTVIDVNLKAPFLLSRALAPAMAARGWGRIVNLGSIMSVVALPGRAPYAAAKAGVLNLTRVLALEHAGKGVTVNAICPGPFGTEMNRPLLNDPEKYNAFVSKIPMGRWGELHEIAAPTLFLASDASSFVTGTALFVDGGWTAQ